MTNRIGVIVKSNSHIDYVCQVFGPAEREQPPQPGAYAFGSFVAIALPQFPTVGAQPHERPPATAPPYAHSRTAELVGLVYNTLLVNPDFGSLAPRLTSRAQQEVFAPDLLDEAATLVGLLALGWQDDDGPRQETPRLAAQVNASVRQLTEEETRNFHRDSRGRPSLRYVATLLGLNNPLIQPLLLQTIDHLGSLFPQEQAVLQVLRNNVAWKSMVRPAG